MLLDSQQSTERSKKPFIIGGIVFFVIVMGTLIALRPEQLRKADEAPAHQAAVRPERDAVAQQRGDGESSKAGMAIQSAEAQVDRTTNTIVALVISHIDDAPTTHVYRMDLGDAGENTGLLPRVGCVGQVEIATGDFTRGECDLPAVGGQMEFHFVPGTEALVNLSKEEWRARTPKLVNVWKSNLPVDYQNVSAGSLDPHKLPLKSGWHDVIYSVQDGKMATGTWTIQPSSDSRNLVLDCVGLQVPRGLTGTTFLIPGYCPDLKADANHPGGFHVGIMRLTTDDDQLFYFGVESDHEFEAKPHFVYRLADR